MSKGPQTVRLQRRTAMIHGAMASLGVIFALAGTLAIQAFGLGLILPGGGFAALAAPASFLLIVLSLVLFVVASPALLAVSILPDDLSRLRLVLDRALQPVDAFDGFHRWCRCRCDTGAVPEWCVAGYFEPHLDGCARCHAATGRHP